MLTRMDLGLAVVHRFRYPWLQYLYGVSCSTIFQVLFLHVPCSSSVFLSHYATWCPVDRLIHVRIRMRWSRVMWNYPLEWHLFLPIQTSTFKGWLPTGYLLSCPPIQTPLIAIFVWSPLQHPFSSSLSSCPMFWFYFPFTFCYWLLNRSSHPCEDLDEMKQSQVQVSLWNVLSCFYSNLLPVSIDWISWGFLPSCMNLGLALVIMSTYPDTLDCNMCTEFLAEPIFQVLMSHVPSSNFLTFCY